jgi:hypothetical protein
VAKCSAKASITKSGSGTVRRLAFDFGYSLQVTRPATLHRDLDHLQLASQQVNVAAPQADAFTPAQTSPGCCSHQGAVAAGECRQELAQKLVAGDRHPGISGAAARRQAHAIAGVGAELAAAYRCGRDRRQ